MDGKTKGEQVSGSATASSPRVPEVPFIALIVLHVAFGLCLGGAPMQDLPHHLTRAHIIADLLIHHGAKLAKDPCDGHE
jgi:hypothetical protein